MPETSSKISCPEDKIYRISASYGKDLEGFENLGLEKVVKIING